MRLKTMVYDEHYHRFFIHFDLQAKTPYSLEPS